MPVNLLGNWLIASRGGSVYSQLALVLILPMPKGWLG